MIKKQENINFYLKLISISIVIFLILNFIFNIGYFAFIGLKFISLLEIRDYYEGTAPLFIFTLLYFIGYFNIIVYSRPIKKILNFITTVSNIITRDIILKTKYKILLSGCKQMSFNIKRRLVLINRDIKKFNQLKVTDLFKSFLGFVFVLFIAVFPLCHSYYLIYKYSKELYFIFIFLYLILVYIYLFNQNVYKKILFSLLIIPFMFSIIGCWAFLRDYKTSGSEVLLNNNKTYVLLRPITKGVILKTSKGLMFYTWNNVKYIEKETDINFKIFK